MSGEGRSARYEVVANVSEGRSQPLIERFADAIRSSAGVMLLDVHSDADHDRSVFTYVASGGEEEAGAALRAATRRLAEVAIETIDLRSPEKTGARRGVHPRIGALDVVPVVPIGAHATLAGATTIAHGIAAELGDLGISVHCYGAAARSAERRSLAAIRRGEFEGLAERQQTRDGSPDYGPRTPHPSAGAVAVGARPPMVAWNIELQAVGHGGPHGTRAAALNTARCVARAIRASSGGADAVEGLQALGLPLESRGTAQVSMNLHDALGAAERGVTLHAIRATIDRLVAENGFELGETEVVGRVHERVLRAGGDPNDLRIRGGWERAVLD